MINSIKIIRKYISPYYHYLLRGEPLGYIFMLHRVGYRDSDKLFPNENMKVSPDFLENLIVNIRDKYDIISLLDVPKRIETRSKKRFVVFTFDDGYLDNYTTALPIFKRYSLPFTIFVATDFIKGEAALWWYEIEDTILENEQITLNDGQKFSLNSKQEKEEAFLKIRSKILQIDQVNIKNGVNELLGTQYVWNKKCKELMMTWDHLREMRVNPLVTIGGHTHHHYNLKFLTSEQSVREEIQKGCDLINDKIGIKTEVFAYPFGSPNEVSDREIKVAKNMNFKAACIAYGGYCGTRNTRDLFSLPRIMLTEDFKLESLR